MSFNNAANAKPKKKHLKGRSAMEYGQRINMVE